jgi:uncharacterized protein YggL (DUF469 family)
VRKRLRKKKHLGEYTEWGIPVAIRRTRQEGLETFLDDFLLQAVERWSWRPSAMATSTSAADTVSTTWTGFRTMTLCRNSASG